jgi:hypothetical protein
LLGEGKDGALDPMLEFALNRWFLFREGILEGVIRCRLPSVYPIDLIPQMVFGVIRIELDMNKRVGRVKMSRNRDIKLSTGKQTLFRATMNGDFLSLSNLSDSSVWGSSPCYKTEN